MYSKENPIPEIDTFAHARCLRREHYLSAGDSRDLSLDSRSAEFAPVLCSSVLRRAQWSIRLLIEDRLIEL